MRGVLPRAPLLAALLYPESTGTRRVLVVRDLRRPWCLYPWIQDLRPPNFMYPWIAGSTAAEVYVPLHRGIYVFRGLCALRFGICGVRDSFSLAPQSVDGLLKTMYPLQRIRSRSPRRDRYEFCGPVLRCKLIFEPPHHPDCDFVGGWLHHAVTELRLRQNCPKCGREIAEDDPSATTQPSVQRLKEKE